MYFYMDDTYIMIVLCYRKKIIYVCISAMKMCVLFSGFVFYIQFGCAVFCIFCAYQTEQKVA